MSNTKPLKKGPPQNNKAGGLYKHILRKGLFVNLEIEPMWRCVEPEIRLGRAIIDRVLLDTVEFPEGHKRFGGTEWFDLNNQDFNLVCYMANVSPEDTHRRCLGVIEHLKKETSLTSFKEQITTNRKPRKSK